LGVKRPVREGDHSPPSSTKVMNAWNYTSTSPTGLHGVVLTRRDSFTFFLPYCYHYKLTDPWNVCMYKIWHSGIINVQSFRVADCDTDQYLTAAKGRERLSVSKW